MCSSDLGRIEDLFASPDFHKTHGPRTNELLAELAAAKARVTRLYQRWEELEAIQTPPGS